MYNTTRQEITLINSGDGTSTSTAGRKPCVTRPFYVRRVGLMITVAGTTTAVVITVKKRVTPGTDTGAVTIGTLTAASATDAAGTAYYLDDLNTRIGFGDELRAVVTTAGGGSLAIDVTAEIEDSPQNPDDSGSVLTQVTV